MMQGQATQDLPVTTGRERRIVERLDVELSITMSSETNFFTGFSENISEGGLFVATHDYKHMGERMQIEFSIPDGGEPMTLDCVVRWTRPYNSTCPEMVPGMGLEFTNLTPWQEDRIQHFVEQLREPMFVDMDFM
jgi:uncharacterized protein (TIGR02266 family)